MLTIVALAAVAPVAVAPSATAVFAPVERRRYRLDAVETRSDGATTMRFEAERTLVFVREPSGWRADLTLAALHHTAPEIVGRMHDAMLASLVGRTLVIHLDARGALVSINDEATIWAALETRYSSFRYLDTRRGTRRIA